MALGSLGVPNLRIALLCLAADTVLRWARSLVDHRLVVGAALLLGDSPSVSPPPAATLPLCSDALDHRPPCGPAPHDPANPDKRQRHRLLQRAPRLPRLNASTANLDPGWSRSSGRSPRGPLEAAADDVAGRLDPADPISGHCAVAIRWRSCWCGP